MVTPRYEPEIWKLGPPPNLGFTDRVTAYWTDGKRRRLISGTHDAHLVSLDAETGKPKTRPYAQRGSAACDAWPMPSGPRLIECVQLSLSPLKGMGRLGGVHDERRATDFLAAIKSSPSCLQDAGRFALPAEDTRGCPNSS